MSKEKSSTIKFIPQKFLDTDMILKNRLNGAINNYGKNRKSKRNSEQLISKTQLNNSHNYSNFHKYNHKDSVILDKNFDSPNTLHNHSFGHKSRKKSLQDGKLYNHRSSNSYDYGSNFIF